MKVKLLVSLISFILVLILVGHVSAVINLPRISTACEKENGDLYAFNDGFSRKEKCEGDSRQVILIGEQGPKGEIGLQGSTGATGSQDPEGIQGSTGPQGPIGVVDLITLNS